MVGVSQEEKEEEKEKAEAGEAAEEERTRTREPAFGGHAAAANEFISSESQSSVPSLFHESNNPLLQPSVPSSIHQSNNPLLQPSVPSSIHQSNNPLLQPSEAQPDYNCQCCSDAGGTFIYSFME